MKFSCLKAICITFISAVLMLTSPVSSSKTPDDQLIIGMSMNNILSLDPAAMTGNDVVGVVINLYDYLVELDPTNPTNVQPGIAKSWEIAPDRSKITFYLRDDAKFHSGKPITAEDFVWSMQRVLNLNLAQATPWKSYGFTQDNIKDTIVALDPYTLEITLPKPNDPKLVIYSLGSLGSAAFIDRSVVMPHEKNGDWGNRWLTTNSAGSGPFILDVWTAKNILRMKRNEQYWAGIPKMKRIIFRHMTESQTLRLMVEKGDIDIATGMSIPDINSLRSKDDITIFEVKKGTLYYVAMNMKNTYFENQKVREAVRYAIDYEGINKIIMPGYGIFHQRPISKGMGVTLPDPGYQLDVDKAKQLLTDAGYPDGFETTINVLSDPPYINIATSVQATFAQVGIKAKVVPGTGNQVYGTMRDRTFDIVVGRGGGGVDPHPHANLRSIVYNPNNSDEARLTNFQGWRTAFYNEHLNQLIDSALIEQDPVKQKSLYEEVQNLYEELVPAIMPVSQMVDSIVVRDDIKNYIPHPSFTTRLLNVEKDR